MGFEKIMIRLSIFFLMVVSVCFALNYKSHGKKLTSFTPSTIPIWGSEFGGFFSKATSGPACPTCTTGLTHYWTLQEASGTRADSVGSVNLSTLVGTPTTTASGPNSQRAICFNGSNQGILGTASVVPTSGSWTVAGWVGRYGALPNTNQQVWGQIHDGGSVLQAWSPENGNLQMLDVSSNGSGLSAQATATTTYSVGTSWYFHVEYYDDVNHLISCNLNNGTAGTAAFTGPIYSAVPQVFGLAVTSPGASTNHLQACESELGVWTKVLSSTELTYLYNSGVGRTYSGGNFH